MNRGKGNSPGTWTIEEAIEELASHSRESHRDGMGNFGIVSGKALGVPVPEIRHIARIIGRNHRLAMGLWDSGIHEARILAGIIAEPGLLTGEQMDKLISETDSWDICDSICGDLFIHSPLSARKIFEWAEREEEFTRRASFVMIAYYAVHRKEMDDSMFMPYFGLVLKYSFDGRNYVKKGIDWALRQMGKRSEALHSKAVETARTLKHSDSKAAKWIASSTLRELESEKVIGRLSKAKKK